MSENDVILDVQNLRVDIPVTAGMLHPVRGISFSVARGETLAIVGESGCGKSLTSLAMMGLLPKTAIRTADKMDFLGDDIRNLRERQMAALRGVNMAMIFQEPMTSLNPAYTIGNQLEEVYRKHVSRNRAEARERAVFLLEKVGITAARNRVLIGFGFLVVIVVLVAFAFARTLTRPIESLTASAATIL